MAINFKLTPEQWDLVIKYKELPYWCIKKYYPHLKGTLLHVAELGAEEGLLYTAYKWIPDKSKFSYFGSIIIRQRIKQALEVHSNHNVPTIILSEYTQEGSKNPPIHQIEDRSQQFTELLDNIDEQQLVRRLYNDFEKSLSTEDKTIMRETVLGDKTLRQVADSMRFGRESVRLHQKAILSKLFDHFSALTVEPIGVD